MVPEGRFLSGDQLKYQGHEVIWLQQIVLDYESVFKKTVEANLPRITRADAKR